MPAFLPGLKKKVLNTVAELVEGSVQSAFLEGLVPAGPHLNENGHIKNAVILSEGEPKHIV
jgi:hypothetical protein